MVLGEVHAAVTAIRYEPVGSPDSSDTSGSPRSETESEAACRGIGSRAGSGEGGGSGNGTHPLQPMAALSGMTLVLMVPYYLVQLSNVVVTFVSGTATAFQIT